MGQDSEEAAEFVATVRTEHVVMKNWYAGASAEAQTLQRQYGPYPSLWKEVLNWPGWKDSRRAYLKDTQTGNRTAATTTTTTTGNNNNNNDSGVPRKRKSRWGKAANDDEDHGNNSNSKPRWGQDNAGDASSSAPAVLPPPQAPPAPGLVLPGMPSNLAPHLQDEMLRMQGRLREINDRMGHLDQQAARVDALPRGHRERSPSPPPGTLHHTLPYVTLPYHFSFLTTWIAHSLTLSHFFSNTLVYGPDGKRKNTRAVRWRERFTAERQDLLERIMNLNPATRQSNLFVRKRSKKIPIPIADHPNYNFIGLIIGPRGKTQKELEAKTGCKVAIRGRGSVKEGARGRRDGKVMEGDNEPLHVVVTGQDQKSVDAAADMVQQMLVVIDDEANVHKQNQLRELALLNGTLKEEEYCSTCAEKGHRAFECPRRFAMNKPTVQIKCAICGDTSHPTRDCTQKPNETNQQEIDSDYLSFMAELDGKKVEKPAPSKPNGAPPVPAAARPTMGSLPTTPANLPLPPPPVGGLPPPPVGGLPPRPVGLPPPPPRTGLPPPPHPGSAGGPLPQGAAGSYYGNQGGHQQQHQQYNAYGNGQAGHGAGPPYHQQQGQHPHHQQAQQQQGQQQQQQGQQQQVRPGEETTGWDPSSYYGNGAGGAGGFNWWEQ